MTSEEKREELNKPPVKYVPVCEECQTASILVNAEVFWSVEENNWILYDYYDQTRCMNIDCDAFEEGGEVGINWILPEDVKKTEEKVI